MFTQGTGGRTDSTGTSQVFFDGEAVIKSVPGDILCGAWISLGKEWALERYAR